MAGYQAYTQPSSKGKAITTETTEASTEPASLFESSLVLANVLYEAFKKGYSLEKVRWLVDTYLPKESHDHCCCSLNTTHNAFYGGKSTKTS
jgi:hypothetical protein